MQVRCVKYGKGRVTGLAMVYPGEPNATKILEAAFAQNLKGIKLHQHVQTFVADSPQAFELYDVCQRHSKPILIHAGRAPHSPGYKVDTRTFCSADQIARALEAFPKLRIWVPHMGADEFEQYEQLLKRFPNLYLDTTMCFVGYVVKSDLGHDRRKKLEQMLIDYAGRIMYGSDFPAIPYAFDREIKQLLSIRMPTDMQEQVLWRTATKFWDIDLPPSSKY